MKRSESQSLYSALPGACITYTSNSKESIEKSYADKELKNNILEIKKNR